MIVERLAETKIRLDRGMSLVSWLRNVLLIVAALKFILTGTIIEISLLWSIALAILVTICLYLLGFLDLDLFKLFQKEAELNTGKYNPFFAKVRLTRKV